MDPLNRFAVIVRPKRRYAEWVAQIERGEDDPTPFDLDAARANPTVYLVAADVDADPSRLIDVYAAEIFEHELDGWCTDESAWPSNRNLHVFRDWFDVTGSEMLFDLDPDEPISDDLVDLDVERGALSS